MNVPKIRIDSLTISTSEIVSKLSTCTSTPTGIAGPEKKIEGFFMRSL